MNISDIFDYIRTDKKEMIDLKTIDFGHFVFIGIRESKEINFENNVGYLLQIREKQGEFGTDQVLIRHPSGEIIAHENQSFYNIDSKSAMLILPYFSTIPGQELIERDFDLNFSVNGVKKTGFYIEFKK